MDESASELRTFASDHWPDVDWTGAVITSGAFHTVITPPDGPIARITTGTGFAGRTEREAGILRTFAGSGTSIPLPRLLDGPHHRDRWSAVLITRVPGRSDPADLEEVRGASYRTVLDAFAQLDPSQDMALPEPRSWCGGRQWPALVSAELVPLLPTSARGAARDRIEEVIITEQDAVPAVCHGDFGPHNLLWDVDGRVAGVFDLDHACVGDPAIDLAPLIGFHGADAVAPLCSAEVLARAMTHRATLSLQVAAAAQLAGSTDLRDHALRNFSDRHDRGTLFDPNGRRSPIRG
ncbi:aminoglycoside phosphotransferase family protein [Microlunatus sp. GCM10028923]|uniref:aminoglycoside phosphotransferase family protein n=1 Tax=Microlunatus sp. GCM10028923 TaxID=3273400 RepID=UPI0036236523